MSSSGISKAIGLSAAASPNALTLAYGNGTVGWATKPIEVRGMEEMQCSFNVVQATLAQIDLKVQIFDDLLAVWIDMYKVDPATGVISLEELQVAVAADFNFAIRLDVQACATLRIVAKGDVAAGTMDLNVIGGYGPTKGQATPTVGDQT